MIRHFLRAWGWVPLLCFLVATLALYAWRAAGDDARALARDGIAVEARITDLDHFETRRVGDSHRSEDFLVTVAYSSGKATDNTLELHEERRSVSESFFAGLVMGQTLTIRMLPDEPGLIEVEPGWSRRQRQRRRLGGPGLPEFLGGLPLPFLLRRAAGAQRMRTRGHPRKGEVVEIHSVEGYQILRYRWRGGDGGQHEGRSPAIGKASVLAGLKPGDSVDLLEDPLHPDRAIWPNTAK
ncbi:MAG: hypothetical protein IPF96_21620 [Rhodobacter sp.]|nr:hypothetical protein [Rhodobacter sp.]